MATPEENRIAIEKLQFEFDQHNHDSINSKPITSNISFAHGTINRVTNNNLGLETFEVGFEPRFIIAYSAGTDLDSGWGFGTYDANVNTTQEIDKIPFTSGISENIQTVQLIVISNKDEATTTAATVDSITPTGFILDWKDNGAQGFVHWTAFK